MFEFNPDGSLKVPEKVAEKEKDEANRMRSQQCMLVRRELVSERSPKKCLLHIKLSDAVKDNRFVTNIHKYWQENAQVPSKITEHSPREFSVEIGTDFRRCTDCNSLINRYREHLYSNLIDKKGTCTFEGFRKNFAYEDYFD